MKCGNYSVEKTQGGEPVTYKIAVAGAGEDKATLEFWAENKDSKSEVLHFDITLDAKGGYVGVVNGRQGARGFCGKNMCTFALTPMENKTGPYGITGVLRFLPNDSLEYTRYVTATTGQIPEQAVYKRN